MLFWEFRIKQQIISLDEPINLDDRVIVLLHVTIEINYSWLPIQSLVVDIVFPDLRLMVPTLLVRLKLIKLILVPQELN